MKKILLLITAIALFSCGKDNEKRVEITFPTTEVSLPYNTTKAVKAIISGCDAEDCTIKVEDAFTAEAYLSASSGTVEIMANHVGETTISIQYGDVKSECKVKVTPVADSDFLGKPLLEFGKSIDYIRQNQGGTILYDQGGLLLCTDPTNDLIYQSYLFDDNGVLIFVETKHEKVRLDDFYNKIPYAFLERFNKVDGKVYTNNKYFASYGELLLNNEWCGTYVWYADTIDRLEYYWRVI